MARRLFRPRLVAVAILSMVVTAAGAVSALAAKDRTPPTPPGDFRVTGTTSYTASLAWRVSTDNSGSVGYVLSSSSGGSVTLPGGTTAYTWRNLFAGYTYTFTIRAVDPSGNSSQTASVSATLPADRTPPTAATLSVVGVGSTHIDLSWTKAVDDGPFVSYRLDVSGQYVGVGPATSYTLTGLSPATTYTITVFAQDNWQNVSPPSNDVTVTTPAPDPADTTPSTPPANLTDNGMVFQDGETWLFWTQSTDDVSPQSLIDYRIVVNGVFDHVVTGRGSDIIYLPVGRSSTVEVIAVDEAGNASAPATIVENIP
jgi:chitodextrinase